jgi:Dot/Icm secretion system protein IcmQ
MDHEKEKVLKLSKKLVEDLEELLDTGDWKKSPFLNVMSKRLGIIRDKAQELTEELTNENISLIESKKPQKLKEGYTEVYIYLYQADGNNLLIWQNIIRSLTKHSMNRPIYGSEEHIKALIRSKPDPVKHAYVTIAIKKEDIIQPLIHQTDSLGHTLLTLKEHSISMENVITFVHGGKKVYTFHDNKLLLQNIIP